MRMAAQKSMPVLFIGHGSPMNAIEENEFSAEWKKIAGKFPKPRGIICISAHWVTEGTGATAMASPRTIHDFYGFPPELYDAEYRAPGSPSLALRVKSLVKSADVGMDSEWGLDHGAWSVLKNMYPQADVPVVQLSLNANLGMEGHVRIGRELAPLRKEGVLVLGSGNVVHNLMEMRLDGEPFGYAVEFDAFVKGRLEARDELALAGYMENRNAPRALPTNEHYLPLLYALGASEGEKPRFFCEKIFQSSLSMRCVAYGL